MISIIFSGNINGFINKEQNINLRRVEAHVAHLAILDGLNSEMMATES